MSRKIAITVYLDPEHLRLLRALAERTRVPMAAYIREGIDAVLANPTDATRAVLHRRPAPTP